jgi:hypothetical protein
MLEFTARRARRSDTTVLNVDVSQQAPEAKRAVNFQDRPRKAPNVGVRCQDIYRYSLQLLDSLQRAYSLHPPVGGVGGPTRGWSWNVGR